MLGIHFMDKTPFKEVYVHALVRDAKGNKMSKSKGNVVDPLLLMDQYGTDTIRFSLTALATQGRDIKLVEDRIVGYRNFITKITNASRFIEINQCSINENFNVKGIHKPVSLWIVNLLYETADNVSKDIEAFRFNEAANKIYQFVWHYFCDWFIEIVKPNLAEENNYDSEEIRNVTSYVFSKILTILHPIIPFNTEYLYSKVHKYGEILAVTKWPDAPAEGINLNKDNHEIEWIIKFISEIRALRAILNIPVKTLINIHYKNIETIYSGILSNNIDVLKRIAKIKSISQIKEDTKNSAQILVYTETFYVSLKGVINIEEELNRLNRDLTKIKNDISIIENKLSNKNFISKAPKDVIDEQKNRKIEIENRLIKLESAINKLK